MDSTYQTNIYNVPLVVFTGIASDGKNILFGMGFINDETVQTYKWILDSFEDAHKTLPQLFVTDGDLSLCNVINSYQERTNHHICQWHFLRNLKRHFRYLKRTNEPEFDRILKLPYIKNKDQFDNESTSLENFLNSSDSYQSSLRYFKEIHSYKEKWADSYKIEMFTAGTNTTSRAESMNKHIKRYMNKTRELSAIIEFIEEFERSYAFEDPSKSNKKVRKSQLELDPIMINIKEELGELIYKKHMKEFEQHVYYTIQIDSQNNEDYYHLQAKKFIVMRDTSEESEERSKKEVFLSDENFYCSCQTYLIQGIICRHMFVVAKVQQLKKTCPNFCIKDGGLKSGKVSKYTT